MNGGVPGSTAETGPPRSCKLGKKSMYLYGYVMYVHMFHTDNSSTELNPGEGKYKVVLSVVFFRESS